jgi:hypothetical protein
MGLQAMLAPHARHHHVADSKPSGKLARRPMGRANGRVARALENPRFQLRRQHRCDLAYLSAVKTRDPLLSESLAPACR